MQDHVGLSRVQEELCAVLKSPEVTLPILVNGVWNYSFDPDTSVRVQSSDLYSPNL